jgi:hypothetical protein
VLLDEIAATDPERILYSIAKTNNMQDGFQDLSYKTIANAVNRCAHWLYYTLGAGEPRVFCYLGPLDIRYIILVLAAPKAGHTVGDRPATSKFLLTMKIQGVLHLASKQPRGPSVTRRTNRLLCFASAKGTPTSRSTHFGG